MKKFSFNSRKFRYGGVTAALTALVIVIVIVANIAISTLASYFNWYTDMTPHFLFTLSDECKDLIANGDDEFNTTSPIEMVDKIRAENKAYNEENSLSEGDEGYKDENIKINIIFCEERDIVESNSASNYICKTADELAAEFSDYIDLQFYDIVRNPSAVSKFLVTSTTTINPADVIVEFGTEYRIYTQASFFDVDSSTGEPWAYNGEKKLTAGILTVTRAESPIACFTINHNETTPDDALYNTLMDAGFTVQSLDLTAGDEIPEDCRLIVIHNPQTDFSLATIGSEVDEIKALEEFLDDSNSLMVFMDPQANGGKRLNVLEDFLETWGVSYDRYTDVTGTYPYTIRDKSNSIGTNGFSVVGEYATDGFGAKVTSAMTSAAYPRKVVFPNAMSISPAKDLYKPTHYVNPDNTEEQYDYFEYNSNGVTRKMFNLFTSPVGAEAMANGAKIGESTAANPFSLMTITLEDRQVQEDNYSLIDDFSYVIACGTTEFTSSEYLSSDSIGNSELLLSLFRVIGREPVPVGIERKPFADYTIDIIEAKDATQYTVVLAVVPAVLTAAVAAVVLIRRKNK